MTLEDKLAQIVIRNFGETEQDYIIRVKEAVEALFYKDI